MVGFLEAIVESLVTDTVKTFLAALLAVHVHHRVVKARERRGVRKAL